MGPEGYRSPVSLTDRSDCCGFVESLLVFFVVDFVVDVGRVAVLRNVDPGEVGDPPPESGV